ncbi:MAG: hypothetical protein ACI9K2_003273 [Myxococcota bacterium]|jgi:hypothetical protein
MRSPPLPPDALVALLADVSVVERPTVFLAAANHNARRVWLADGSAAVFLRMVEVLDARDPDYRLRLELDAVPLLAAAPLAEAVLVHTTLTARWPGPDPFRRRLLDRVAAVVEVRQGVEAERWSAEEGRLLLILLDLRRPPLVHFAALQEDLKARDAVVPDPASLTALAARVAQHAPVASARLGGTLRWLVVLLESP